VRGGTKREQDKPSRFNSRSAVRRGKLVQRLDWIIHPGERGKKGGIYKLDSHAKNA